MNILVNTFHVRLSMNLGIVGNVESPVLEAKYKIDVTVYSGFRRPRLLQSLEQAPSTAQAERMLTDFDRACGKIALQLKLTRTMLMRNGYVSDAPISLNRTTISECSSYVCLGREVNTTNETNGDVIRLFQGRRHPSSVVRWGFAARFAARELLKYTMANATLIGRVTRNDA
ncbi:unnamed protein product [Nippostrongylus brasiliensis]|uniref:Uncharacterized protein n=1 Tax=Nippostrongylus brasiliensis TaxID=27835 RepID=A0A0N4YK51_NIPBR|nr:unnamed protein product [Nippostrongylus brasiliensis]